MTSCLPVCTSVQVHEHPPSHVHEYPPSHAPGANHVVHHHRPKSDLPGTFGPSRPASRQPDGLCAGSLVCLLALGSIVPPANEWEYGHAALDQPRIDAPMQSQIHARAARKTRTHPQATKQRSYAYAQGDSGITIPTSDTVLFRTLSSSTATTRSPMKMRPVFAAAPPVAY